MLGAFSPLLLFRSVKIDIFNTIFVRNLTFLTLEKGYSSIMIYPECQSIEVYKKSIIFSLSLFLSFFSPFLQNSFQMQAKLLEDV